MLRDQNNRLLLATSMNMCCCSIWVAGGFGSLKQYTKSCCFTAMTHPNLMRAKLLSLLSLLCCYTGQFTEAEHIGREALRLCPATHSSINLCFSAMHLYQGKLKEAEALLQLSADSSIQSKEMRQIAIKALEMVHIAQGNIEMADTVSKENIAISTKVFESVDILGIFNNLLRADQGSQHNSPEDTLLKVISSFRRDFGEESAFVTMSCDMLARNYIEQERCKEAETLLISVKTILEIARIFSHCSTYLCGTVMELKGS